MHGVRRARVPYLTCKAHGWTLLGTIWRTVHSSHSRDSHLLGWCVRALTPSGKHTVPPTLPRADARSTLPHAARYVDTSSRRDRGQRRRGTRAMPFRRPVRGHPLGTPLGEHGNTRQRPRERPPRRLAPSPPPHDPYLPPTRKKCRQPPSEGATAASHQPGPHTCGIHVVAITLRELYAARF
jgi:hypothetical protein